MKFDKCPECGSANTDRIAVDIGVGTQLGPLECGDCGYSKPVTPFDSEVYPDI